MLRFAGCCLTLLLLLPVTAAAQTWRAGVAKAEITPEKMMWMSGYAARTHAADSKLTDLWAKALVLEDANKQRAVLITLDLIGVDRELGLPLRQKIAEKMKLDLANVMICTSHTHSGPVVAKNLRPLHYLMLDETQRKLVDRYATLLEQTVLQTVDVARMRLAPCTLSHGSGTCGFAVNRRNNPEAEAPKLREQNMLRGPSDHDVPVLAVRNSRDELISVVFGYACHATVLDGYAWCGDYPGYAQIELEKEFPTAIAMFWAGCGGDQNPIPRRKVELAATYGKQLADSVSDVLDTELKPVGPKLAARYVEVNLALASVPTTDELAAQANDTNKYVASRAKFYQAELAAGREIPEKYPYPIGLWRLGDDVEWIFLGGEVVVDYALRLKGDYRQKNTWVAAYANDVMAYIPSRRVLAEGGYEGGGAMVYYGLPSPWKETVEEDIASAVKKLSEAK